MVHSYKHRRQKKHAAQFFFLLSLSATVLLRCCKVRLYDKQGINKALQPLSI